MFFLIIMGLGLIVAAILFAFFLSGEGEAKGMAEGRTRKSISVL